MSASRRDNFSKSVSTSGDGASESRAACSSRARSISLASIKSGGTMSPPSASIPSSNFASIRASLSIGSDARRACCSSVSAATCDRTADVLRRPAAASASRAARSLARVSICSSSFAVAACRALRSPSRTWICSLPTRMFSVSSSRVSLPSRPLDRCFSNLSAFSWTWTKSSCALSRSRVACVSVLACSSTVSIALSRVASSFVISPVSTAISRALSLVRSLTLPSIPLTSSSREAIADNLASASSTLTL